jgi:hypothetical protein
MTRYRMSIGIIVALVIALVAGALLYARSNSPGNDVSGAVHDAPQQR